VKLKTTIDVQVKQEHATTEGMKRKKGRPAKIVKIPTSSQSGKVTKTDSKSLSSNVNQPVSKHEPNITQIDVS